MIMYRFPAILTFLIAAKYFLFYKDLKNYENDSLKAFPVSRHFSDP